MKKLLIRFFAFIVTLVIAFFLFYQFWFLRLPDREIPTQAGIFISPANGVVKAVKTWHKDKITIEKNRLSAIDIITGDLDDSGVMVSIEMDPLNVHYQRAPATSRVISTKYAKGEFKNALVQTNEYGIRFENEYNSILLESESGIRYKVVQIAGFLARRIVDFVEDNQRVERGEVIGLIKMGSQVSVIFPEGIEILVREGDVLIDGETIIARE